MHESVDDPADLAAMAEISDRLVAAADAALEPWVLATVRRFDPALGAAAGPAAVRCRTDITARLRELLSLDIDAQSTTPLAILRSAGRYPTEVLLDAGVARPRRDPFDERVDPDDVYGLAPATWADLGPEVAEAGLVWGAAKAHLHLRRRRP